MAEPYAKYRIVSLCPSITETLIDFGCADRIVGITRFCIHPAAIVKTIQHVGGTKDPDLDAIRALAPDIVFMNEEENRREDFLALAGDLRVETSLPKHVAEVPDELRRVGKKVGTIKRAETRARELEAALERLDAEVPEPFTYAYLIWKDPWMTVNDDTYVADLLRLAGGSNVFGGASERYPTIDLETLSARRPDVVFLPDEPFPFKPQHAEALQPKVSAADVRLISGDDCCWHGVRSIRGVRLMEALARERRE